MKQNRLLTGAMTLFLLCPTAKAGLGIFEPTPLEMCVLVPCYFAYVTQANSWGVSAGPFVAISEKSGTFFSFGSVYTGQHTNYLLSGSLICSDVGTNCGIQTALINDADGGSGWNGIQLGGFNNGSSIQLGLLNREGNGIQLGLVNDADDIPLQVGLVNRASSATLQVGLYNENTHSLVPEFPLLNLSFR